MGGRVASTKGEVRRITRSLAFVFAAFALILQANSPIQATLMAVGSDLPGDLCAVHGSGQNRQGPTDQEKSCAACAVCIAGAGMAILSDPIRLVALIPVVFAQPAPLQIYQARAPPARAPKARGPPLKS